MSKAYIGRLGRPTGQAVHGLLLILDGWTVHIIVDIQDIAVKLEQCRTFHAKFGA